MGWSWKMKIFVPGQHLANSVLLGVVQALKDGWHTLASVCLCESVNHVCACLYVWIYVWSVEFKNYHRRWGQADSSCWHTDHMTLIYFWFPFLTPQLKRTHSHTRSYKSAWLIYKLSSSLPCCQASLISMLKHWQGSIYPLSEAHTHTHTLTCKSTQKHTCTWIHM